MACFLQNKGFLCSVQGLVAELIHISANVTEPELGTHWVKAKDLVTFCETAWHSLGTSMQDALPIALVPAGQTMLNTNLQALTGCFILSCKTVSTPKHISAEPQRPPDVFYFSSWRSNTERCPKCLVLLPGQCSGWHWQLSGLRGNWLMC